jgi:hypothetical protein
MQPLDRDHAQIGRQAAAMLASTLQQRAENDEQRTRTRVLMEADRALRRRARLGDRSEGGSSGYGRLFTEREGEALRCASDGRVTWSLG